ncbi:MAG TPA: carbamoyl phosphate synthase small subunit [Lachnospiraceae bacterium]|nr:glutamine-hydrolyzing carbamoyl-phosphate synthase small subunit [Lachnospiraceae bacterium]MBQ9567514.1 glutamine-hydrolyzing carbamoyl-phosphate synthase small subunit [Lachnospiraceae bacterium]HCR99315.1 carbamoyl phosphate synthase small subunit [Lachnospiraceae bacterium]
MDQADRKIILEDGAEYCGHGFGSRKDQICEIVFNTSMVGYQEIISDPSYTYQGIVMTYPLIGNYGMASDDYESLRPSAGALIVREYNDEPSNHRSTETLSEVMERYDISGISGVDTRKITRSIRDLGSRKMLITDIATTKEEGLRLLNEKEIPKDAVRQVSPKQIWRSDAENRKYHVVAIDCGMKSNIVRSLNRKGCSVTVVPYDTSAKKIRDIKPDGLFVSNGPGDPQDVPETIATVKELIGEYPIFGICLGHQILSLAHGARTYKLKFGHRGGNHPVKDLSTGRIEVTSQNHSYAVDAKSLEDTSLTITHINLLDDTVEGVADMKNRVFSVQYHPESAPGPQDSSYLFDRFIEMMA